MKQLSLLIALAACSGDPGAADPGATVDGGNFVVDPPTPVDPDLGCVTQPATTIAPDPIVLAGSVAGVSIAGVSPVDAAQVDLFRAGEPVMLARTHSGSGGAFSTGSVPTGGYAVHAYLKATKEEYRTSFFYPPAPFAASAANVVVPVISNAAFDTVASTLGVTQNDRKNGVLFVAVVDCSGAPLSGASLKVHRGNSPNAIGETFDVSSVIPGAKGVFLVFNVPDGKVFVSATYNGVELPEHDVMVRSTDPDCIDPRGTLTSTIVRP